jgi:hypothetical protein
MLVLECLLLGCRPTEAARRVGGNIFHVQNAQEILRRNGLSRFEWAELGAPLKRELHAWMRDRLKMDAPQDAA